jgi:nickel transport protein
LKLLNVAAVIRILMQPNHQPNRRKLAKLQFIFPLALLSGLAWQMRALAHGVAIDYQETQAIEITAIYDTGEPMANAQVVVYAPSDPSTPWMAGTTTETGIFTFTPDRSQAGNWEVSVRQAGHGELLSIPVEASASSTGESTGGTTQATEDATESEVSTTTDTPRMNQTPQSNRIGSLTPMQRALMAGSAIWGFVGTALFFTRGKR